MKTNGCFVFKLSFLFLFLPMKNYMKANSLWHVTFVWAYITFWRRQWQPIPVLLPGKSHGQRSLVWRVGHDWATSLSLFTFTHWRRKWQPTPVFLPGESQGQESLMGFRLWGCTELDMTEATSRQQQQQQQLYQRVEGDDWFPFSYHTVLFGRLFTIWWGMEVRWPWVVRKYRM